jgi:hypothetical protein
VKAKSGGTNQVGLILRISGGMSEALLCHPTRQLTSSAKAGKVQKTYPVTCDGLFLLHHTRNWMGKGSWLTLSRVTRVTRVRSGPMQTLSLELRFLRESRYRSFLCFQDTDREEYLIRSRLCDR